MIGKLGSLEGPLYSGGALDFLDTFSGIVLTLTTGSPYGRCLLYQNLGAIPADVTLFVPLLENDATVAIDMQEITSGELRRYVRLPILQSLHTSRFQSESLDVLKHVISTYRSTLQVARSVLIPHTFLA